MKRVGVLDLLIDEAPSRGWLDRAYRAIFKKQYASIMPQAVSVWCRQLGHDVRYATYYGQAPPERLLPADLDVVFVSAYTQASALAYALARLYRRRGSLTVIGGPHARSFPRDCLRFFDVVVDDCDRGVVADILRGRVDRGSIVGSGGAPLSIPGVEERMPEIATAVFARGRPVRSTNVALLTSVGCPYRCDFCSDWNTPYAVLPPERLERDLRYLSERWPGVMVSYHDPNFAVRFDDTLAVLERIPRGRRPPYIMESSLSVLRGSRVRRLRETNCIYVAPGVESWGDYTNKAGVGSVSGPEKLVRLLARFRALHEHGFGLQANFLFGTDADRGDEPVELTKEFVRELPFVWSTVNVPTPFGGTPLHDACRAEGRLLETLPLAFYYTPFLVTVPKHYDPVDYYGKLIDVYSVASSPRMLARRMVTGESLGIRTLHALRTLGMHQDLGTFRRLRRRLVEDRAFRTFHHARSRIVPEFYHRELERKLGPYAELLPRAERSPLLEEAATPPEVMSRAS